LVNEEPIKTQHSVQFIKQMAMEELLYKTYKAAKLRGNLSTGVNNYKDFRKAEGVEEVLGPLPTEIYKTSGDTPKCEKQQVTGNEEQVHFEERISDESAILTVGAPCENTTTKPVSLSITVQ